MALRHNRKKKTIIIIFFFFFSHIREKNHLLWKKNTGIKAKDKTLMQYQITFTRNISLTKKPLESMLVESEQRLGLYKECLTKNTPL